MIKCRIQPYSEKSFLIRVDEASLTLKEKHETIRHLNQCIRQKFEQKIRNLVPSYDSLFIEFQYFIDFSFLNTQIENFLIQLDGRQKISKSKEVIIPVCYDFEEGSDLKIMAEYCQLPQHELVRLHTAEKYQVFMIGFLPGFAYMGEVPEKLAIPRKKEPVFTRSGSVGIADRQTGIYPADSQGGWHIIGFTPLKMFSVLEESPSLLQPGDIVTFRKINTKEYFELLQTNHESY